MFLRLSVGNVSAMARQVLRHLAGPLFFTAENLPQAAGQSQPLAVGFHCEYHLPQMGMLTTAEVAERLGVSPRRVRELITDERLPAQKFGRDYLIEEKDLRLVKDRKPGRPPRSKGKKQ